MALGVIRVRGNLCKYTGGGPKKKGKFVSCSKQRITGGKKRGKKSASKRAGCRKQVVSNHGNRRCRSVCRNSRGKVTSSKPASGCRSL